MADRHLTRVLSWGRGFVVVAVTLTLASCSSSDRAAPGPTSSTSSSRPTTPTGSTESTTVPAPATTFPAADKTSSVPLERVVERQVSLKGGGGPDWMTVGFGSLWVKRDNNVVVRLAPDGTVLATIDPGVFAEPVCQGLGVSDHAIWGCAAPGKIARIDPQTNQVSAILDIPKVNEQGRLPTYDGRIWVLTGDGDQLVGISERTNRASRTVPLGVFCTDVADQPVRATLWVACPYDGVVLRVDLDGGKVTGRVGGLQQAAALTASTESVWVCTKKGIAQVDVASMTVTTLQLMAAGLSCNLRLIDDALWVRTGWRTSPFLARIDTSSGQLVQTVSRPGRISGGDFISFADALWVSSYEQELVFKLESVESLSRR